MGHTIRWPSQFGVHNGITHTLEIIDVSPSTIDNAISQQFEAANENYKFYIFSEQLFYPIALFADKSKTGEKLARFFINWYNANWQLNWGKPFLIRRAIGSYPNLKHLIDQRIIDGLSLSQ